MTKKLLIPIAVLILLWAGSVMATIFNPNVATAAASTGKVTVNGMGEVRVQPDIAYVTIGYTNQHTDSRTAQSQNNAQVERIIEVIKSLGIADNDIQTTQFNIFPHYDHTSNNRITGYNVTNMLRITVRNLEQAGELVDMAVNAGANAGGDIQFSIADPSPHYERAMDLAIQNAISKANAIGNSLQVSISSPREVTELGGNFVPVLHESTRLISHDAAAAGMPVQAGVLSVRADIQVVFEY